MSARLLAFVDEFAPVWSDPQTGITKPMTAAAWVAAGFEVIGPTRQGYWVVNLDSRRASLPAGAVAPDPPHALPPDPATPGTPHTNSV